MERPHNHSLEDLSRSIFAQLCARVGWVVVDLSPDYGEDALVFIYEDMKSTGDLFLVQLKASCKSKSVQEKGIPISIKTKTLQRWKRLRLPVVLILYHADSEKLYWLEVAQYLASNVIDPSRISNSSIRIHVPFCNELTLDSLKSLKKALYAIPSPESHSALRPFGLELRNVSQAVSELEKWSVSVIAEEEKFRRGTGIIEPTGMGLFSYTSERLIMKRKDTGKGNYEYEVNPLSCHDPDYRANLNVLDRRLNDLNQSALTDALESLPTHLRNLRAACVAVAKNLSPPNATAIISIVANLLDCLAKMQTVAADLSAKQTYEYQGIAFEMRQKTSLFKHELEQLKWAALDIVIS